MIKISIRKKLKLAEGETILTVDAELPEASLTALYGASGAGKTTLLKIMAGLMQPDEGVIEVEGQTWLNTRQHINLPPQKRSTGFVFQDYALFPNMTVAENLQFAAPHKNLGQEITQLLEIMQLEQMKNVRPHLLSGGQQQRVALARAIIRHPRVLLMDEPLSALGSELRFELRSRLAALHKQYNFTAFLVSHDAGEIYQLADRVLHLHEGKIVADGTPAQVFGAADRSALQWVGEVIQITAAGVIVLVNHQVLMLPLTAVAGQALQPGQKVSLLCNWADLTIQKLS